MSNVFFYFFEFYDMYVLKSNARIKFCDLVVLVVLVTVLHDRKG